MSSGCACFLTDPSFEFLDDTMDMIRSPRRIALGAIVRNEAEYLLEWLAWHRLIGFTDFFISDNDSDDGTWDLLSALERGGVIRLRREPRSENAQRKAYGTMLREWGGDVDRIAFLDADEFLVGADGTDPLQALESLITPPDVGAVAIHWRLFGSSGHIRRDPGLVIERFDRCGPDSHRICRHFKSYSKPQVVIEHRAHHAMLRPGYRYIDTLGRDIEFVGPKGKPAGRPTGLSADISDGRLRVHHYVIKSRQEFEEKKQRRGNAAADPGAIKPDSYFHAHDLNHLRNDFARIRAPAVLEEIQGLRNMMNNSEKPGVSASENPVAECNPGPSASAAPRKTLLLHIGMHKTGSSAIQASLDGFDDQASRYARLGNVNHSIPVYTVFSRQRDRYHIHRNKGLGAKEIESLRSEYSQRLAQELALPRRQIIVSGEDISILKPDEIESLRDFCLSRRDEVRVLAYVRDPVSFANSAMQEQIKGGAKEIRWAEPGYKKRFAKFLRLFGASAVNLVEFDRRQFLNESVVNDFCSRAGIDAAQIKALQTNDGLSQSAAEMLLAFNREGPDWRGSQERVVARQRLVLLLGQFIKGPSYRLPPSLTPPQSLQEDVDWLLNRGKIDFRSALDSWAPQESSAVDSDSGSADLERLLQSVGLTVSSRENDLERLTRLYEHLLSKSTVGGRVISRLREEVARRTKS